jgi:hypothetical protein
VSLDLGFDRLRIQNKLILLQNFGQIVISCIIPTRFASAEVISSDALPARVVQLFFLCANLNVILILVEVDRFKVLPPKLLIEVSDQVWLFLSDGIMVRLDNQLIRDLSDIASFLDLIIVSSQLLVKVDVR